MAFDYTKSRATAEKLIENFGQSGAFYKTDDTGGYDEFGAVIPDWWNEEVTISGTVTPLLPFSTATLKDSYEVEGLNILASDKYCFFHSEVAPEVGYFHEHNGVVWRVVAIMSEITSVDGVNVFRKIQLRR